MHADCCTDYAACQAVVFFKEGTGGTNRGRLESKMETSSHLILSSFFHPLFLAPEWMNRNQHPHGPAGRVSVCRLLRHGFLTAVDFVPRYPI